MKAVKAKYDNGGKVKYDNGGKVKDPSDYSNSELAAIRARLKKQIADFEKERKSDYSTVSGQSSYGKANPKDRGVQAGGSAMKSTGEKSGLAGDIDKFYNQKIAKLKKMMERYAARPEEKAKMLTREEMLRGMGGDDESIAGDAAFEAERKKK